MGISVQQQLVRDLLREELHQLGTSTCQFVKYKLVNDIYIYIFAFHFLIRQNLVDLLNQPTDFWNELYEPFRHQYDPEVHFVLGPLNNHLHQIID